MNSWLPGAGIPDFGGAPYPEMAAQLGALSHDALAAAMPPPWAAAASSRPGSATATGLFSVLCIGFDTVLLHFGKFACE